MPVYTYPRSVVDELIFVDNLAIAGEQRRAQRRLKKLLQLFHTRLGHQPTAEDFVREAVNDAETYGDDAFEAITHATWACSRLGIA